MSEAKRTDDSFVIQLMPSECVFDGNSNPPVYSDNRDQEYATGTKIRVKVLGIRAEVGQMYGIATIKEVSSMIYGKA